MINIFNYNLKNSAEKGMLGRPWRGWKHNNKVNVAKKNIMV
jgi:hypothetical protein